MASLNLQAEENNQYENQDGVAPPPTAAQLKKAAADPVVKTIEAANKRERAKDEAQKVRMTERQRINSLSNTKDCQIITAKRAFCGSMVWIRIYERAIEKQNKIAQQSGVINKGAIYQATSNKINLEEQSKGEQAEYKKLSGKDVTRASCGLVDQPDGSAKPGDDLDRDAINFCGEAN
jgi:hypothetical protein